MSAASLQAQSPAVIPSNPVRGIKTVVSGAVMKIGARI